MGHAAIPRDQIPEDKIPRDRRRLGALGEAIARSFLERRGLVCVEANRRAGRGEIDLLMRQGRLLVAVEVRTTTAGDRLSPLEAADDAKLQRVVDTVAALGRPVGRIDLVAVRFDGEGATVHWSPGHV